MAAECIDHRASEEVQSASDLTGHRALDRHFRPESRKSPDERRPDEFGLFGLQGREERCRQLQVRIPFQPFVGDLANPVVAVADQLPDQIGGAAIVERRQQYQRAVAHELVGVAAHRFHEGGHRLRLRRPANEPGRLHPHRIIQRGQVRDVLFEISRSRSRGLCRWLGHQPREQEEQQDVEHGG